MKRPLSILVSACVLAAAAPAAAEGEEQQRVLAQQLFDEAEALLSAKHVTEACPKYAESYRLDPQLGVLIYLAECYEQNGQLASAWAAFREAEGMALSRNDRRLGYTRDRIDALTPRLSRLTVFVPAQTRVKGLTLYRNGLELSQAAWGMSTPTDAGSYVLEASAPDRRHWTTSVVVPPEGGNVTVTVPELPPSVDDKPALSGPPKEAPKQPPTKPFSHAKPAAKPAPVQARSSALETEDRTRLITALAVGGAGVIGLGVGGILALSARSKFDDSKPLCNDANVCTPEGTTLRDDAQRRAVVASLATGVGAAAVVGGVVLWLTAPSASKPAHARASWSIVPATSGWGLGAHRAF